MQRLRQARFLARLVLAWFALAVGAAVAAPLVQPKALQLVCSGSGGLRLLLEDGEEPRPLAPPTLDCPLCAVAAPPAMAGAQTLFAAGPAEPPPPAVRAVAGDLVAQPPARGPPQA